MNAPFLPGRGFRDPVLGSQSMFRAVLTALSRPGQIVAIPEVGVEGPSDISPDILSLLLSLCDHETPVWLDAEWRATAVARWLAFHANCPVTDDPARASFALLRGRSDDPAVSDFAQGDPRYPDRSTTVIVCADSLSGGVPLVLEGPGIEARIRIAPVGLPEGFVEAVRMNHTLYPLGVDFLLVAGHAMTGLPRTTRIVTEDC